MEVLQMLSEKGKPLIVVNKFKFCVANTLSSGIVRWRCVNKGIKCQAKIYTSSLEVTSESILLENTDLLHNHSTEENIQRQALSNRAKRKAVEDLSERPAKIILKELRHDEHLDEITMVDLDRVRRNMYKARRSVLSVLPNSTEEVFDCLENLKPLTNKKEDFLLVNSASDKVVVFSCLTNLEFLCSVDVVYMDGTFDFCTKYFMQFFTIHGFKNGHYVPLVFALLPRKTAEIYTDLFNILQDVCSVHNLIFSPKTVTIDFEMSIHKAVKEVWTGSNIIGCRFHLCQAWFRKIQQLGLAVDYNHDTEIGKYLKHFFGLQFLDPSEVEDCFRSELLDANVLNGNVKQFTDYLLKTYISSDAIFPPLIWAAKSDSTCRTTNACESFHSDFNKSFYSCHPSIHQFVDILINFQCKTYVKIVSARKYEKKIRKDVQLRQQYIKTKIDMLDSNIINRASFVKCVSYKFAPSNRNKSIQL